MKKARNKFGNRSLYGGAAVALMIAGHQDW